MDLKRKTVLLVDDDMDIIAQMRVAVEKHYNVLIANSGEEALETLAKTRPDCIVLDVMMSHMSDGLDITKKIRENQATKTIPIIMLTAVNQHYDYRTQVGEDFFPFDKWLDKPVKSEKLLEEIKSLIK